MKRYITEKINGVTYHIDSTIIDFFKEEKSVDHSFKMFFLDFSKNSKGVVPDSDENSSDISRGREDGLDRNMSGE